MDDWAFDPGELVGCICGHWHRCKVVRKRDEVFGEFPELWIEIPCPDPDCSCEGFRDFDRAVLKRYVQSLEVEQDGNANRPVGTDRPASPASDDGEAGDR